jgi:predicted dehydrogenase
LGEFTQIEGFTENFYWGGNVEDNAFVIGRTKKGTVAQIHVSWTNWDWVHCVEIFGTKGYLRIDGLDTRYHGPERLTVGKHNPRSGAFPKEKVIVFENEHKEDSFTRELAVFADIVRGKKRAFPSGQDAVHALTLIEEVYTKNKKK